jgi:membrane protein DedA with SNARE-associated domain
LENFLSQAVQITSSFSWHIAVILFLLCFIGEAWIGIPYVLETVWLLSGYQLAIRPSFFTDLILIWLVTQAGRQAGSLVLYYSGILGIAPLKKFYKKFVESRLPKKQIIPSFIKNLLTKPSVFSVAVGRLFGFRIPMAIMMSANRKLAKLSLGVLTASIIWDGIYIIVGRIVGPSLENKPQYMLLYSLAGLTLIYLLTLGTRIILRKRQLKNTAAG